jgi:pimeloyl-ACP methyl ester carboxylesterase
MDQADPGRFSEEHGWPAWSPAHAAIEAGLVSYPGGKVEPAAYARSAQAIAAEGFLVVIPPVPLNLAVLAPDRAGDVMAAYPDVTSWVVGGHSLGGAMAGRFTASRPDDVRGLALWAAFPDGDLSEDTGDCTGQPDDPPATITRDDQQAIARAATVELLRRVSDAPEQ